MRVYGYRTTTDKDEAEDAVVNTKLPFKTEEEAVKEAYSEYERRYAKMQQTDGIYDDEPRLSAAEFANQIENWGSALLFGKFRTIKFETVAFEMA